MHNNSILRFAIHLFTSSKELLLVLVCCDCSIVSHLIPICIRSYLVRLLSSIVHWNCLIYIINIYILTVSTHGILHVGILIGGSVLILWIAWTHYFISWAKLATLLTFLLLVWLVILIFSAVSGPVYPISQRFSTSCKNWKGPKILVGTEYLIPVVSWTHIINTLVLPSFLIKVLYCCFICCGQVNVKSHKERHENSNQTIQDVTELN